MTELQKIANYLYKLNAEDRKKEMSEIFKTLTKDETRAVTMYMVSHLTYDCTFATLP